jgi:hypothetical protein
MVKQSAFSINSLEWHYHAAANFECGIKKHKGYEVNFVPIGFLGFKPNYIMLSKKIDVQEDNSNQ